MWPSRPCLQVSYIIASGLRDDNHACEEQSHNSIFHWNFQKYPVNQNLLRYHWLSVSGNSEIMHCGIIIITPYWNQSCIARHMCKNHTRVTTWTNRKATYIISGANTTAESTVVSQVISVDIIVTEWGPVGAVRIHISAVRLFVITSVTSSLTVSVHVRWVSGTLSSGSPVWAVSVVVLAVWHWWCWHGGGGGSGHWKMKMKHFRNQLKATTRCTQILCLMGTTYNCYCIRMWCHVSFTVFELLQSGFTKNEKP